MAKIIKAIIGILLLLMIVLLVIGKATGKEYTAAILGIIGVDCILAFIGAEQRKRLSTIVSLVFGIIILAIMGVMLITNTQI